jgi:hypothetical protein
VRETPSPRFPRLALWAFAVASFAWGCLDPRFRDSEGFLTGAFCLPLALSAALALLGIAAFGRSRGFALWLALALLGQAAALQLVDAGPLVGYQHLKPWNRLPVETPFLVLAILALQAGLVTLGLRARWPAIRAWLGRAFRSWQLVGAGLVFVLSSAAVSRWIPHYSQELVLATWLQAVNLVNILLAAWALPGEALEGFGRRFEALVSDPPAGSPAEHRGVDRFALLAALWVAALAALLGLVAYERHPHVPDEVVYLYHARYLAEGKLTLPVPPAPEAIDVDLMHYEPDRWYSPVPPGWPAMLALGALVGAPWLVNPLLAGLNMLLAYALVRELYDRRAARLTALLLCASPWHIFMAMNFMTHTFTLTCALAAALGISLARRTGKVRWAGLAGLATGMVSLIRPLEGLIVAGLLGLWALGVGGRRLKVAPIAAFAVGALLMGAAVLPYNALLTGDPTVFPIMAYTDKYYGPKTNALGFGPERGLGWPLDPFPGHGPLDALVNADLNVFSLNVELFGWSTGSLLPVALLVLSGALRKGDGLMLAAIASIFGIHALYWFSGGPDFGARYWYLMLVPLVALTVSAVRFLERKVEARPGGTRGEGARVLVAVLSLCALALATYFPWRAIDKYHHYRGMRPDIRVLAKERNFGRSLVLVRGSRHPDYASAATYNPVDLHAPVPVYAWNRNPTAWAQALQAYADRPVWLIEGPSLTGKGYEVVAGPLAASALLARGGPDASPLR